MTPTVYMEQLGLFEYGGGLYHCVHMSEEDLDVVKRHQISVITNPASNLKLASGSERMDLQAITVLICFARCFLSQHLPNTGKMMRVQLMQQRY